ncbi:LysR family transcriptional regulator [Thalassoglobus sp. JC818]|uniref:LysR family transcriptional regulator n=1 Tax=Thalassoglobus sp. JC818 TaxID=3232136 RepID=UPI00345A3147
MGVPPSSSNVQPRASELSVQQMQTFQCVFEENGYAPAARRLQLSVPTVWQQIQAVERLYEATFFEKEGRRIVSTLKAQQLYDQFSEILAGIDSTFETVSDERSEYESITLVTGVRMLMEDLVVPLKDFRDEFENTLVIRHGNNRLAEEMVLSGEADLALTLEAESPRSSARVHFEPAYFIDFLAIAEKSHPYCQAKQNSLRELVKHDLVVTVPGTHGRDAFEHAIHREHLNARVTVETDNSGFTIACVRAGLGVGVVAGRLDGHLCDGLFVRSLRKQLGRRQIVFLWKRGRKLTGPMKRLVEIVQKSHE